MKFISEVVQVDVLIKYNGNYMKNIFDNYEAVVHYSTVL